MVDASGYLDRALCKVFAISLRASDADQGADPPVIYLQGLAEEFGAEGLPLALTKDTLDRMMMARLLDPPEQYPQWPLDYLIGCYGRVSQEIRALTSLKDKDAADAVQLDLQYCKQLISRNAGLLLSMALFPQPEEAQQQGAGQLVKHLINTDGLPAGFVDELVASLEPETLMQMCKDLVQGINKQLQGTSPLGDYSSLLTALQRLTSTKVIAKALTTVPNLWLGQAHSRSILTTLLGPAFNLSVIPDPSVAPPAQPQPNVGVQCFGDYQSRRQADLMASVVSLRLTQSSIGNTLHSISMNFLRSQDTRGAMLDWIANAIELNAKERSKMKMDPREAAPHGFFLNLNAVLLQMSEPFLEPLSGKAWGKIDAGYATNNKRISFEDTTKLNMEAEEERTYLEQRRASQQGTSSSNSPNSAATGPDAAGSGPSAAGNAPNYHFICECFFLTAKGLHLGLIKAITDATELHRELPHYQRAQQECEAACRELSGFALTQMQAQLTRIKALVDSKNQLRLSFDTALQEPNLLRNAIGFYRLLAAWLLRLAYSAIAQNNMPFVPLPEPAPIEFRSLPEYFVDDLCELLLYVGQTAPKSLEALQLEEILVFMVVFMGSPGYVKNPFLRSRIAEVLYILLQPNAGDDRRRPPVAASVQTLIESHPVVQQYLVRSLMQLYVDIEFTDRSNSFYEKFSTRVHVGLILEALWYLPSHRESWKALAAGKAPPNASGAAGGQHVHLQFCNMIVNDSTYLLGEALEKLPQVRELEALMDNKAAWDALPKREQQEKESELRQQTNVVKHHLTSASIVVKMLQYSTTEVTSTWLLPEMVLRVANMLNYFLQFLTGPNRRQLKVKNPDKFNWKPKELLPQLASIYLHLDRADAEGAFAKAIAGSDRYRQDMFPETCQVLRSLGLMADLDIDEMESLAQRVEMAKHQGSEEDIEMADAPDEFLDPITYTIMQDPVKLPSGAVMDRPNVLRMLLSDPRDPTTRAPLSQKDLRDDTELKAKIQQWMQEQRSK